MKKIFWVIAALAMACLTGCGDTNVTGKPAAPEIAALPPVISDDGFDMVLVEGGTFLMGCNAERGDSCARCDEPPREVAVGSFYAGKTEVTQKLWKAVMDTNPSHYTGNDDLPVDHVSLDDARAFVRKLNRITGKMYRLPTEAEWEYAARGGNSSKGYTYSGSNNIDEVAWYNGNSGGKTHPVGTKQPNELGLYDMSGNVMEWTNDALEIAWAIGSGDLYIVCAIRGGSSADWYNTERYCTVYDRRQIGTHDDKGWLSGFRLALSPKEPDTAAAAPETSGINIDMVFVKGGIFVRGSTKEQYDYPYGVQGGRGAVSDFYIGKYEVTRGLWNAVMGKKPSFFKRNDNRPVNNISFNDAQEFIRKLNEKTGKKYRLPADIEWEYAARGGNRSNGYFFSGSDYIDDVAWYWWNSGKWLFRKTRPVGTKQANELGIHDMSGNVMEWTVNESDTGALLRGADWLSYYWPPSGGIFCYENYASGDPVKTLGLRLAMSPDKPAPSTSPPDVSSNPDSIAMVFVEGGMFTMRCRPGDDCSYRNGAPLGSFYMGKYEVTQGLWKAVMGYNPSIYIGDDNLPVEQVNTYYGQIQAFIEKLNAKTGKKYRLPTGAEWEYAASGGNRSKGYAYSGSNNIDDVAWHNGNSCGKTHPVGTKQPNELGLHDMTGNVSEETAPKDDSSSGRARGGSWKDRVSCDDCGGWREYEKYYIGFRLAHDP